METEGKVEPSTSTQSTQLEDWGIDTRPWHKASFVVQGSVAFSSFISLFFFNVFLPITHTALYTPFECACMTVAFFTGMLIACILGWYLSDPLSKKQGTVALAVFSAILSPFAAIAFALSVPYPVVLFFFAVAGCGITAFLLLTAGFLGAVPRMLLVFDVPLCVGIAAAVTVVGLHIRPVMVCFLFVILVLVLGAFMGLTVHRNTLEKQVPFVCVKESAERSNMSWKSSGAAVSQSCCLGYAMVLTLLLGMYWSEYVLIAVGVVSAVAAIVMVGDRKDEKKPVLTSEKNQLRFFLPCAAVGLLPVPFVGAPIKAVCCCLLVLVFTVQAVTNIYAIAESVRLFSLQPIRSFSGGRVANYLGYTVGSLIAVASFGNGLEQTPASVSLTLLLMVVLIFLSALFFVDRFPVDQLPIITDESIVNTPVPEEEENRTHLSSWKDRCSIFAKKIGLSPRQEEVLLLLSRGYSAKYIEEHLFISYHTAKSHIHSIYQKAGIHSREELIEMIERTTPRQ